ncbi:hypothetical protein MKS88_004896 [Plasmodium brasilianum]|uniref:Uncharacterized protein n=1 Tax=Plasmodium brasilianum TaxID=5824 RepID=A0ACB9Y5C9_PLABR|nr:hypothetical protein MKS88_004896 [Plasmodium brasilianum]
MLILKMKLNLLILNYLIFGNKISESNCAKCNLKGVQNRIIPHSEGVQRFHEIGVSEQAIKKLKEMKKLELEILKDFIKKDTDHVEMYKKFHCIASDFVSYDKKEAIEPPNNVTNKNNKQNEPISNDKPKKSESFIDKITSFVGIFNYNNMNKIYSDQIKSMQQDKKQNTANDDLYNNNSNGNYNENNNEGMEIAKNQNTNSYMQLNSFISSKENMFLGGKDNSSEHYEVGNLGSFYMIFGARNTDYPWACTCDPLQLIEYKEKKRKYVLCSNQVDMSIQNADLFCNPKNASYFLYLSYIFTFLIIIVHF